MRNFDTPKTKPSDGSNVVMRVAQKALNELGEVKETLTKALKINTDNARVSGRFFSNDRAANIREQLEKVEITAQNVAAVVNPVKEVTPTNN